MNERQELEKFFLDRVTIGGYKLTDLASSNRLMSVGFCKECDHCNAPLRAVVDGEVRDVSDMRCSINFSFVDPNGWCYKFQKDGKSPFLDSDGHAVIT